jgi:ABC-type glycerol-3-phosphate transport system permease component
MVKEVAFTIGLQTPSYFAAIFVSVLPVVLVFLIFNKQIMNNVSVGGLKG